MATCGMCRNLIAETNVSYGYSGAFCRCAAPAQPLVPSCADPAGTRMNSVPREPTEAMMDAGGPVLERIWARDPHLPTMAAECWRAMWDAYQKAPE